MIRYMGGLEKKTNATFHQNIGSLNTAIEEEWNKMYEKYFWKRANRFEHMLK